MTVIWKIAFRNLREHRSKTLIIGTLVTIGIAVLVIGNSLMDTAASGIERTYTSNYTGHLIVTGKHRGALNLFGMQGMDALDQVIPRIPEYQKVRAFAESHPDVAVVNPQATALATMSLGEEGGTFGELFGIDPVSYRNMFPDNVELTKGQFIPADGEGMLLSQDTADRLKEVTGKEIIPGDSLLLTGMNMTSGIKVREVKVWGIFTFKQSNAQLDMVSLVDITNLRALAGMTLAEVGEADLSQQEKALLGDVNEGDLFGDTGDSLFGGNVVQEVDPTASAADFSLPLGGQSESGVQAAKNDSNAWHFLLIKLKDPSKTQAVMHDFQQFFDDQGIEATTMSWLTGAGPIGELAYGMKNIFNIIVLIIAVVAVIIVMNTLVISITERVGEIGTMRAIGAQKKFVRRMIVFETLTISGVFGFLGIVLGAAVIAGLNALGIEASNMFFEIVFGGKVFRPELSPSSVLMSVVVVVVIGVVASLYPVSVALKIKPVKAMQDA